MLSYFMRKVFFLLSYMKRKGTQIGQATCQKSGRWHVGVRGTQSTGFHPSTPTRTVTKKENKEISSSSEMKGWPLHHPNCSYSRKTSPRAVLRPHEAAAMPAGG